MEGRGSACTATVWDTFSACVPNVAKAWKVAVASYATGKVTWPESVSRETAKGRLSEAAAPPPPPASTVSLHRSVVTVATTSKAATAWGKLGGFKVEVMLDSGSSVSLVWEQMLSGIKDFECVSSRASI